MFLPKVFTLITCTMAALFITQVKSTQTTLFEACAGIDNLLGITHIDINVFNNGLLTGFVQHTPTVTLNGPAFVTINVGPQGALPAFILDFNHNKMLNPNGLPIAAGTPNTLVTLLPLSGPRADSKLAALYDGLPPGASIPVIVNGYTYTYPVVILGCINFNITKPAVSSGSDNNFGGYSNTFRRFLKSNK